MKDLSADDDSDLGVVLDSSTTLGGEAALLVSLVSSLGVMGVFISEVVVDDMMNRSRRE